MSDEFGNRKIDLRFSGSSVETGASVSAIMLAKSIIELQKIVHLVGMRLEGRTINRRARIPVDIQKRFVVKTLQTETGSYIVPCMIGETEESDLIDPQSWGNAAEQVTKFFQAILSGAEAVKTAVPDPIYRRMMLDAAEAMMPPEGSGIILDIMNQDNLLLSSKGSPEKFEQVKILEVNSATFGIVTGRLVKIDFDKNQIDLIHPPSSRRINCSYDPIMESLLLSQPRELVQVSGQIEVDDQGIPVSVSDVRDIIDIDVSPIVIEQVEVRDICLKAKKPFEVIPIFDDMDLLYLYKLPFLDIESFANTRHELVDSLSEELAFIWKHYACEDDERLTSGAKRIKTLMISLFDKV
jgi:hypothetical protein